MEPRNATAPNEPRGEGRHRGPRCDRHPPSRQDVSARDDRDDSEEEAEAEQARRGCQEARHGFQDDQGERVRERSHRKYGRALTRFEPAVQVRGRERGLQAPDDVDRDLEEDRARKYAGAVYAGSVVRATAGSTNVRATKTATRFKAAPANRVSRRSRNAWTTRPPAKAPAAFARSWIIVFRPMYRGNSDSCFVASRVS